MARCSDLRRGYKLNPLGMRTPVTPAPGQPMPSQRRYFTVERVPSSKRLGEKRPQQVLALAAARASAIQG